MKTRMSKKYDSSIRSPEPSLEQRSSRMSKSPRFQDNNEHNYTPRPQKDNYFAFGSKRITPATPREVIATPSKRKGRTTRNVLTPAYETST